MMKVLGELTGSGTLLILDKRHEDIPYHIRVTEHRNVREGTGTMTLPSIAVADRALRAKKLVLMLESGHTVDVIVSEFTPPSLVVQIKSNGAVPGF